MFSFWDWVRGRFLLQTRRRPVVMLAVGPGGFGEFLAACTRWTPPSPLKENLPAIAALLNVWYAKLFSIRLTAVLPLQPVPYRRLPAYLQQGLTIESNGESRRAPTAHRSPRRRVRSSGVSRARTARTLYQACCTRARGSVRPTSWVRRAEPRAAHATATRRRAAATCTTCSWRTSSPSPPRSRSARPPRRSPRGHAGRGRAAQVHARQPAEHHDHRAEADPVHPGPADRVLRARHLRRSGVIWGIDSFDQVGVSWARLWPGSSARRQRARPRHVGAGRLDRGTGEPVPGRGAGADTALTREGARATLPGRFLCERVQGPAARLRALRRPSDARGEAGPTRAARWDRPRRRRRVVGDRLEGATLLQPGVVPRSGRGLPRRPAARPRRRS